MYKKYVKRLLDILISVVSLIVLSPFLLILALVIKLDSPGPIIFIQERLGLHGKVFHIYKFRTMRVNAEHTGSGVYSEKGDFRVTRVGRIYRMLSLDELPQLICLLVGTMSLIGPRPPLTYHPWPYDEYTVEQRKMFDVRPGITGWAQVNGRNTVEWNRRIEYSVWYAENVSLLLDIKIFFMTIYKVLRHKDVLVSGSTVKKPNDNKDAPAEVSQHGS